MTNRFDRVLFSDAVVVGSGIAGLSAALELAPRRVTVLSKGAIGDGSTAFAQGGIAAAVGEDDDPAQHAADTIAVGAGLNNPVAVAVLTDEGPGRIEELARRGVRFDREPDGSPSMSREAGHRARRVLHADGDSTGAEISRALVEVTGDSDHIEVLENAFAADLVVAGGRIAGLTVRLDSGEQVLLVTPAVILATGGVGRLYANTTNPEPVTGDGVAMAARAGVRLADVEFVQFHPTALATGRDPMSLLTEALRGDGAVLLDDRGRRFMVDLHPDAELAPRDVVARANWGVLASGGKVFLDAIEAVGAGFPEHFPTVFGLCREDGIDPRTEPMPAAPAAHYHMGGIVTDLAGRASIPGLWAVGEAARTGVHGANRLASNSLLEGSVFGRRAGADVAFAALPRVSPTAALRAASPPGAAPDRQSDVVATLRDLMWEHVGLVRDGTGLLNTLGELDRLSGKLRPGRCETANMLTAARLIATAALIRTESRGGHYRSDHPSADDAWLRPIVFNS